MTSLRRTIRQHPLEAISLAFFTGVTILTAVVMGMQSPPTNSARVPVAGLRLCHPTIPDKCLTIPPGSILFVPRPKGGEVLPTPVDVDGTSVAIN